MSSPLDSGFLKLVKTLLEKSIKLEDSFLVFDIENEEIIDKKQFVEGLNQLNIIKQLNKLEIDAIFTGMDTNSTDCVTEDEYYIFMENQMKPLVKEIKQDTA